MVLSVATLATSRPGRLRLASLDVTWVRIDTSPAAHWDWNPFPTQQNRFDAPVVRVRYAARTERGAFRERFADRHRRIQVRDAGTVIVALSGRVRVVDLRNEATLDALGVDGEISTGRSTRVFTACSALTGRLLDWYGADLQGIVYTSRTTPQTSANLAFFAHAPLRARSLGRLADRTELLTHLVLDDGFRIDLPDWQ